MIEVLLEPFSYRYMLNAMWVSALVGGVCAFLSAYLMLKGWSLIGDALSHSVVPGVAGAYILGLPFALGAFLAGGLAAGAMLFLSERSGLKADVIIGIGKTGTSEEENTVRHICISKNKINGWHGMETCHIDVHRGVYY